MPRETLMQVRRGTAAQWTSANPTLDVGEFGFETDTGKLKIGDGSTAWTSLTYSMDASKVTGATLASNVTASSLTSVGTLGSLSVTGTATAGTFSGAGTSLTGTASSLTAGNATKLATARTIDGVSFDGSANITGVGGLVFIKSQAIGSGVSTVVVSNVFSSTYDNYFIQVSNSVASANQPNINMQLGSTTTNYAYSGYYMSFGSTTITGDVTTTGPGWPLGSAGNGTAGAGRFSYDCIVRSPNLAQASFFSAQNTSLTWQTVYSGHLNNTTQYTDFTILPTLGTLTGGTIRVYGYRNS